MKLSVPIFQSLMLVLLVVTISGLKKHSKHKTYLIETVDDDVNSVIFSWICSTKNHFGRSVFCMSGSISFFAIYSKRYQATHTWKFVTLPSIFLRMPLWKKDLNNLDLPPFTALIKQTFLQPQVEMIFRYH